MPWTVAFLVVILGPAAIQNSGPARLDVIAAVGCLQHDPQAKLWRLVSATAPDQSPKWNVADPPGTLIDAARAARGAEQYRLIGFLDEFNASASIGQLVLVKGILVPGAPQRLNITSLRSTGAPCSK
jgi:hypothetical protein